ncbi:MAG: hypothetical protein HKO56_03320, partial [Bacteroidia bacterium]|nr:hypothetical protein [Bacteroidia bacterium]NNM15666.1 hypothetical protein [Bacteroidia bacterium]
MNPIVKNILAVLAGIIVGMAVNMGIIMLLSLIIPPPDGVDPKDMESIREAMLSNKYSMYHFISPWLAHAGGTFVGALVAVKIAANNHLLFALVIGAFFLVGGIMMVQELPSPLWFNIVDIVGAYIP